MSMIDCPCCGATGSVIHGRCNGAGCSGCESGELPCDVCGGEPVAEPFWCLHEECERYYGDFDQRVLTALLFLRIAVVEVFCLDHARADSVARRWATDAKACTSCGTYILWRHELGRRICLDSEARHHACPEGKKA